MGRKQEGDEESAGDSRLTWQALDTPSHSSTTWRRFKMYPVPNIMQCIFRWTLMQKDYSPVTKIDLPVLQMIFQQR